MPRVYSTIFDSTAITAAIDLVEWTTTTTKVYRLVSAYIGQTSDAGDAADELLRFHVVRGSANCTSGSGGTTGTLTPVDPGDSAGAATVEIGNTTRMSAGSGSVTTCHVDVFNVRAKEPYRPTEKEMIWFGFGQRLTVSLPGAPADSLTTSFTFYVEEFG